MAQQEIENRSWDAYDPTTLSPGTTSVVAAVLNSGSCNRAKRGT